MSKTFLVWVKVHKSLLDLEVGCGSQVDLRGAASLGRVRRGLILESESERELRCH